MHKPLVAGSPPPAHYYADNLQQLLAFVRWRFRAVLQPSSVSYIERVLSLPSDALRLLARLLTRKGPVFRPGQLAYAEISDLDSAIDCLLRHKLLAEDAALAADQLLRSVRLQELKQWYPIIAGLTKAASIEALTQRYSDQQLRSELSRHMRWLSRSCDEDHQRCLQLYFGNRRHDLSAFVIEDLGLLNYPSYRLSKPDWLTADPRCLAQHEQLQHCAAWSHRLDRQLDHRELAVDLSRRLNEMALSREQAQIRDRALLRLAAHLERQGYLEDALHSYAGTQRAPSAERRVRILNKLGRQEEASRLVQDMQQQPGTAAEIDFAQRVGQRRSNSYQTTEVCIVGATPKAIESCAQTLLAAEGGSAWHLENQFPLGITGLLYWDAIFLERPGAFTRPFQLGPNDLYWADFAKVREPTLRSLEAQWLRGDVVDAGACRKQLQSTFERHHNTANLLVNWRSFDSAFMEQLSANMPMQAVAVLAGFMIRQLHRFRSGFPDLLVIKRGGEFEFVEVKGPTDQLQGNQRLWLQTLEKLNLPARVLKLRADKSQQTE